MQIDSWASENGLIIVGYYVANENINDNTIDKCSTSSLRIAEKITEQFNAALFTVVSYINFLIKCIRVDQFFTY